MAKKGIQLEEQNGGENKGYSKSSTSGESSTRLITFLGRTPISWGNILMNKFNHIVIRIVICYRTI